MSSTFFGAKLYSVSLENITKEATEKFSDVQNFHSSMVRVNAI
jgi:hypothetical protein